MSEADQLNWVERRHRAEKNLADSKVGLWRDVCAAITDASRSFGALYETSTEVTTVNGHRLRIMLGTVDRIDVDFDEKGCGINTSYASPFRVRNFRIRADHVSAFIVDDKGNRMTPDEVSESILAPVFFPR